jgi:chromate reductase
MKFKIFFAAFIASAPIFANVKVLTFAGSTRSDSHNKKLSLEAAEIARQMGAEVISIDLRDYPMPFYDHDLEEKTGMPEHAKRFRKLMVESDVILISTPTYNGSIPAVLKNAIDWASRTEEGRGSREAFKGKKFGLMGVNSGGKLKAIGHLRQILEGEGGLVVEPQTVVSIKGGSNPEKEAKKVEALKEELGSLIPIKTVR